MGRRQAQHRGAVAEANAPHEGRRQRAHRPASPRHAHHPLRHLRTIARGPEPEAEPQQPEATSQRLARGPTRPRYARARSARLRPGALARGHALTPCHRASGLGPTQGQTHEQRRGAHPRQRWATQTNPQAGQSEGARIAPVLRHIWWQQAKLLPGATSSACRKGHSTSKRGQTSEISPGQGGRGFQAMPWSRGPGAGGASGVPTLGRRGTGHSGGFNRNYYVSIGYARHGITPVPPRGNVVMRGACGVERGQRPNTGRTLGGQPIARLSRTTRAALAIQRRLTSTSALSDPHPLPPPRPERGGPAPLWQHHADECRSAMTSVSDLEAYW